MGPGAEPVEEDYFQDEPVNVAKRFVGVAGGSGGGTKQRGWARRRENIDWVGRLVAEGEMWVSGVGVCVCVCGCLEGWRSGGLWVQRSWYQGTSRERQEGNMRENSNGNLRVTVEISLSL